MTQSRSGRTGATLVDVARAAGVSTATAARALGEYGSVREATREKVSRAAGELGYVANGLARSMITGRTRTLGAIVADIENPFFSKLLRGISDVARHEGLEVILANTDESLDLERAAVRLLLDKRVDGMIVAPSSAHEADHLLHAAEAGSPVVLVDRLIPGAGLDSVTLLNRDAAENAVGHLVAVGHRRIGYISGAGRENSSATIDISTGGERIAGYRSGLKVAGIPFNHGYVRIGGPTRSSAQEHAQMLFEMQDPPTAVITADSIIALGLLDAIREREWSIPSDISVVTFDDPEWATVVTPPLTVVAQPAYALGESAAKLLIERINGESGPRRHPRLRSELIARGSVAPPRTIFR